jgi:hypothetical protein
MKNKPTVQEIEAALNAVDVFDPCLSIGFRYAIDLVPCDEALSDTCDDLGLMSMIEVHYVGEANVFHAGSFGLN